MDICTIILPDHIRPGKQQPGFLAGGKAIQFNRAKGVTVVERPLSADGQRQLREEGLVVIVGKLVKDEPKARAKAGPKADR